jgi:hypothetical protein
MTKKKTLRDKIDLLPIYKLKYEVLSKSSNKTRKDVDGNHVKRDEIFLRFLDKSIDDNKEFYIRFIEIFGLREFYKVLFRYLSYDASKKLGKEWDLEGREFPEGSSRRASGKAMRSSEKLKNITKGFTMGEKKSRKMN